MTSKGRVEGSIQQLRVRRARGVDWQQWAAFDIALHLNELLGHPA